VGILLSVCFVHFLNLGHSSCPGTGHEWIFHPPVFTVNPDLTGVLNGPLRMSAFLLSTCT
jgi:hypothetical protein